MARIRQLPRQVPPEVEFLPREEYLEAVRESSSAPPSAGLELQQELGIVPRSSDVRVEEQRLLTSLGVYVHRTRVIYVVDEPTHLFPFAEEGVLAHECLHALQDENGLLSMRPPRSTDALLAQEALIEGDATVGELLYAERKWHTSVRRVAEHIMRGVAIEPISRQVAVDNPEPAKVSAIQKEILLFPYRAGAAFVGTLLSTGGYELVAKAFATPPGSTAQILHPERYARGERPISIPVPAVLPGLVARQSDVLGELMTRSLLLRCNSVTDSIQAAEGWRGDRVVSLREGESTLTAQQWVLETEPDARELATALAKICPAAPLTGVVMKKGTRVVAVRGGTESTELSLAQAWLSVPLTTPEALRPLGQLDLKPTVAVPDDPPHVTAEGWLRYPAAFVELQVPCVFSWSTRGGLQLADSGFDAVTWLQLTLSEYFPSATDQILLGLGREMATRAAYSNIVRLGDPYAIRTVLGEATAQDFQHEGTVYGGRVVAVPLCRGELMLSVVQTWGDTSSALKSKRAIASMRAMESSDFCDRLTH